MENKYFKFFPVGVPHKEPGEKVVLDFQFYLWPSMFCDIYIKMTFTFFFQVQLHYFCNKFGTALANGHAGFALRVVFFFNK